MQSIKSKNTINLIFNIWAIAAVTLLPICEPNINRLNIIFIPLIYYTGLGLYEIITDFKIIRWVVIIGYIAQFVLFTVTYINKNPFTQPTWNNSIENVITYVDKLEEETVYFEYSTKEPYIYVLFYNQIDTNEFVKTVKYKNDYVDFESVQSFGKYKFFIPSDLDNTNNSVIVLKKSNEEKYNINDSIWKKSYIDDYLVLTKQ